MWSARMMICDIYAKNSFYSANRSVTWSMRHRRDCSVFALNRAIFSQENLNVQASEPLINGRSMFESFWNLRITFRVETILRISPPIFHQSIAVMLLYIKCTKLFSVETATVFSIACENVSLWERFWRALYCYGILE